MGLELLRKILECFELESEFEFLLIQQLLCSQFQNRDDALTMHPTISLFDVPSEKLDDAFHVFIIYSKFSSFNCRIEKSIRRKPAFLLVLQGNLRTNILDDSRKQPFALILRRHSTRFSFSKNPITIISNTTVNEVSNKSWNKQKYLSKTPNSSGIRQNHKYRRRSFILHIISKVDNCIDVEWTSRLIQ